MKLKALGEDGLLDQLLPPLPLGKSVFLGAGDDCALVNVPSGRNFLVLKTDCIVEGIHFLPRTNPLDVGWKAMMRPLSDFAAASAVPQFALITLIASKETEAEWVKRLYGGLSRAAKRFKVSIVGGETSSTRGPAVISVSVIGFVEKKRWVSRRGGKVGDDLFVTGRLGGAIKGKHLQFVPRIDLPRLARASKVSFKIEVENLPLNRGAKIDNAVSEGEDYELLFAISPRQSKRLQKEWRKQFPKLPLTRIGRLSQLSTLNPQLLRGGYLHFQQRG